MNTYESAPKEFQRAIKCYRILYENANNEGGLLIWEGTLTKVFLELNVNLGNYSGVVKFLKNCGSIKLLRRGNRDQASAYIISENEPTLEDYLLYTDGESKKRQDKQAEGDKEVAEANAFITRLASLEKDMAVMKSMLSTIVEKVK